MTDHERVAPPTDGDDVLGRRGASATVDRARALGSNTLSGFLDILGGAVLVTAAVLVGLLLVQKVPGHSEGREWVTATLVASIGATCGLMLFALARMVTYAKACAVLLANLLAKLSADTH